MSFGRWFAINNDGFDELRELGPAAYVIFGEILRRVRWNGNRSDLKIGEALIGRKEVGEKWGFSEKVTRSALNSLELKGFISCRTKASGRATLGTVVTVLNSSFYNCSFDSEGQPKASQRASNPHTHTQESRAAAVFEEPSQGTNSLAEVPVLKKEEYGARELAPGEVTLFVNELKDMGLILNGSDRNQIRQAMQDFETSDLCWEWLMDVHEAGQRKHPDDLRKQSRYLVGAIVSHLKASRAVAE